MNLQAVHAADLRAITADLGVGVTVGGATLACVVEQPSTTAGSWAAGLDTADETTLVLLLAAPAALLALGRLPRRGDAVTWDGRSGAVQGVDRAWGDLLRVACVLRAPYAGHGMGMTV